MSIWIVSYVGKAGVGKKEKRENIYMEARDIGEAVKKAYSACAEVHAIEVVSALKTDIKFVN
jgi:hypothetical protein